jgi:hypothetical protein
MVKSNSKRNWHADIELPEHDPPIGVMTRSTLGSPPHGAEDEPEFTVADAVMTGHGGLGMPNWKSKLNIRSKTTSHPPVLASDSTVAVPQSKVTVTSAVALWSGQSILTSIVALALLALDPWPQLIVGHGGIGGGGGSGGRISSGQSKMGSGAGRIRQSLMNCMSTLST